MAKVLPLSLPEDRHAIKQMPAYDPDAVLNGLTFTAASWSKAVLRVRKTADFRAATPAGRRRLQRALSGLMAEITELTNILEATFDE